MERQPETFKPPKRYSVPNPSHGVKVKVEVMQRVKGRRHDFSCEKKMAKIGARKRATGVTRALGVDGPLVLGVTRVPDVDTAARCEKLAEQGFHLEISDTAKEKLIEIGYSRFRLGGGSRSTTPWTASPDHRAAALMTALLR